MIIMGRKTKHIVTLMLIIVLIIGMLPIINNSYVPQEIKAAPMNITVEKVSGIKLKRSKVKTVKVKTVKKVTLTRSANKKKITVKTKLPNNATGVQIAYKTKSAKKFKTIKTKKTKYVLKVKAKKDYQVKVRAYYKSGGKIVYGKWSTIKKSIAPKYSYKLTLLNNYPIYNGDAPGSNVILYLETDNPDGAFYEQVSDEKYSEVICSYDDILVGDTYDNRYKSKSGKGYVSMFSFDNPGKKTFKIFENVNGKKVQVASINVTVNDEEKHKQKFCRQVIEKLTKSGQLTDDMDGVKKMKAIVKWVDENFRYIPQDENGKLLYLASREGSIYDTRQGTCIGSGSVVCVLANYLGYKSRLVYAGYLQHYDPVVTIDGVDHKYVLYGAASSSSGDTITKIDYLVK